MNSVEVAVRWCDVARVIRSVTGERVPTSSICTEALQKVYSQQTKRPRVKVLSIPSWFVASNLVSHPGKYKRTNLVHGNRFRYTAIYGDKCDA